MKLTTASFGLLILAVWTGDAMAVGLAEQGR